MPADFPLGLTFDDVLLVPQHSDVLPRDVSVAPETRPDGLQTMPAALGPFIDSETGRLEEPRSVESVADVTLDLGGYRQGSHNEVLVGRVLRLV